MEEQKGASGEEQTGEVAKSAGTRVGAPGAVSEAELVEVPVAAQEVTQGVTRVETQGVMQEDGQVVKQAVEPQATRAMAAGMAEAPGSAGAGAAKVRQSG